MSGDARADRLLPLIRSALEQHFGDRLAGAFLFGSRARGQHRPDSDFDIAVVLKQPKEPLSILDEELLDLTYPLELEEETHIQAWALPAEAMGVEGRAPAGVEHFRTRLAGAVRREGIPF